MSLIMNIFKGEGILQFWQPLTLQNIWKICIWERVVSQKITYDSHMFDILSKTDRHYVCKKGLLNPLLTFSPILFGLIKSILDWVI